MIRHILSAGASVLALTLTVPAAAQDAHEMEGVHEAFHVEDGEASSAAVATPTMSFGTWGFDPETLSPSIDPGDDFFAYANQKWLDANPLPPEYSRFGAFNLLREKSTSDVKTLVDELVARDAASLSAELWPPITPITTMLRSMPPALPRRSPISTRSAGRTIWLNW